MIILEGPDNAGKTTLGNKISTHFNEPLYHAGGPPADADEAFKRLSDTLNKALVEEFPVHDRHILFGENVYGRMAGRVPFISWEDHIKYLMELNPLIIYCRPNKSKLLSLTDADFREDEPEEHRTFIRKNAEAIIDEYDKLMSQVPHIRWDFTEPRFTERGILTMCRGFMPRHFTV